MVKANDLSLQLENRFKNQKMNLNIFVAEMKSLSFKQNEVKIGLNFLGELTNKIAGINNQIKTPETLENNYQCLFCFDYHVNDKDYSCSNKHFVCWKCLEQHIKKISEPDFIRLGVDKNCSLLCKECKELITLPFKTKELVPPNIFDLLEKFKSSFLLTKLIDRVLNEQRTRLKFEFERIMAIQDKDQREAQQLRLKIIENVFTIRCPCCKIAISGYKKKYELICLFCRKEFCTICLLDGAGGDNAQMHFRACHLSPSLERSVHRMFFENMETKSIPQFGIRIKIQNQIIDEITKDASPKVKSLLEKVIKDLKNCFNQ